MELKILIPDSKDYCEAVGISPARQQELSKALDDMVRRLNAGPIRLVPTAETWAEIASHCTNAAELVYCTVLHCGWHHRQGRVLAPGPLNYGVIGLGIEQLYDRLRKDIYNYNSSRNIMAKLVAAEEDDVLKEGAREGVQRLLDLGEAELARDIMNKLTGFAF